MNSGPTPPRPDDEARDPLLTALQQRLHDYGQAPPPSAWAAIRQQLPPAAPRPWWRRSRRLLPLLALLLGLVAVGTLAVRQGRLQLGSQDIENSGKQTQGSLNKLNTAATPARTVRQQEARAALAHAASAVAVPSSTTTPYPSSGAATTTATVSELTQAATLAQRQLASATHPSKTANSPSENRRTTSTIAHHRVALATRANTAVTSPHSAVLSAPIDSSGKQRPLHKQLIAGQATSRAQRANHRAASRRQNSSLATFSPSAQPLAVTGATDSDRLARPHGAEDKGTARRVARPLVSLSSYRKRRNRVAAATQATRTKRAQTETALADEIAALGNQPYAFDSLALKPVALDLLPALAGPVLVARPDSSKPLPRARRWSLLVLAGPTLSYRTLGAAPTLATQHPDFAHLERPALGFGAQVQVRRVLSGRWALAVGAGYHKYATRLALSVIDSSSRIPRSVHQRDVYRVLTLPVQFSYTLGVPQQRVAWALLFGVEPSWYLGGRSTEGSGCGCQQQVYPLDSARTGPYRPLTLALSLGLDLRYRLGGPASRWQWVVQPTARYVITPFVRNEAVGFTRRQPWSLGLLTGISWDIR
jgi:hypothetical protein